MPGALSSESPWGLRLQRAPSLARGVRAAGPALRAPCASPGARRGLASLPALSKSTPGARTAPSGQGSPGGCPPSRQAVSPRAAPPGAPRCGGTEARGSWVHSQPLWCTRVAPAGAKAEFGGASEFSCRYPIDLSQFRQERVYHQGRVLPASGTRPGRLSDEAPETASTPRTGRRSRSVSGLQSTWSPQSGCLPPPHSHGGTPGASKWRRDRWATWTSLRLSVLND